MLDKITNALNKRKNLADWTVRHITTRGAQSYAVPKTDEARRSVSDETYKLNVLMQTKAPDGAPAMGTGEATLLPGGDIEKAIDTAEAVAAVVANPPYGVPEPAPLPDVPLVDKAVEKDFAGSLAAISETLRAAAAKEKGVRLTSSEVFGDLTHTYLVNSRGVDAEQDASNLYLEFILQGQKGERSSEMMRDLTRRQLRDLDIEANVKERARYTRDLLEAGPPPNWQGPVVLRGSVLADFMVGDNLNPSVIRNLAAAQSKFAKLTPWEVGKSVFREEVSGDPLTVWANRTVPYGVYSNRFDREGLPAQRVELIKDNQLVTFSASQRYADYLGIPATGDFGLVEVAAGKTALKDLLSEPYVEICLFSWFNPEPIGGDFATEIRLGYLVENGKARPFRGGQLIGNVLTALADCRWSQETGFYGVYTGPQAVRVNELKVAGAAG